MKRYASLFRHVNAITGLQIEQSLIVPLKSSVFYNAAVKSSLVGYFSTITDEWSSLPSRDAF